MKADLHLVRQWLVDNKLSLHLGKTESILFGSKQRIKSNSTVDITCNDTIIKPISSVKYLGATIDQTLSFDSMARSVKKSLCMVKISISEEKLSHPAHQKTSCHGPYSMSL